MPETGRATRAIEPWTTGVQAAICLAFAAFAVGRALRVSLTYDEAAAYIRYIAPGTLPEFDTGSLALFNFEVATNHFLGTALTLLSARVAGSSELALRAPALAGYAMYLWFSVCLLRRLASPALAAAGVLLLNLNPYLLDFFALSRGYGLALGFMMGGLYFFFSGRPARALFLASAAVLANFAMLNVYAGLVALVTVEFRRARLTADPPARRTAVLAMVAAVFAALVFSQDAGLSPSLYEPVTVTLDGLHADELAGLKVSRVDLRGRSTRMTQAGPFRAVRIRLPAAAAARLRSINVVVGNRAFANRPDDPRAWIVRDIDGVRELESGPMIAARRSRFRAFAPVINWAGDARYAAAVTRATAIALGTLALLGILLNLTGRLLARAAPGAEGGWRAASASMLWVAAFAGPPLYILRRDAQLYFGGTRGLIPDTFYSLIENSFYGRLYHAAQAHIVFGVLVLTVTAFALFAVRMYRTLPARTWPALQILALMAIASASLVAQHWLFGTVYLAGRAALFYIPLYLLFLIFFCQSLSETGPLARLVAAAVLAATVALCAYHGARTFNLQYTFDWRDDAATKAMMADLENLTAREGPPRARVVLGVEPIYAPAAVYYAHRRVPVDVDIDVAAAPAVRPVDFLYVGKRHATGALTIVRTYPIPDAVLARRK